MPVRKKPAANQCGQPDVLHSYIYPGSRCGVCSGQLYAKLHETPVPCTIVGSEIIEHANTVRKECKKEYCVHAYRANFAYIDSTKVNTMSFRQLEEMGVYMVTNNFGFTMKYLQMSLFRLLRGNLAPGQEASVRTMLDEAEQQLIAPGTLRSHLLRALEGYALAQRTPHTVVPFPTDDPASFVPYTSDAMTFEPPKNVKVLSFDGHFGLNRMLNSKWGEAPRTVRVKGRPRKKYFTEERTCSCADKAKQRVTFKNRTAGWQFVIDPSSRRILAAKEHVVNECLPDKVAVVEAAMKLKNVKANALIHDDACHFEAHIHRHACHKKRFRSIKHFIVDEFHRGNHKCKKCKLTSSEAKRFKNVRTNMSEVFNSWIRRKNFIFNGMRPSSHKFWVHESICFWNDHLREMPQRVVRRTTAATRKRPASSR